MPARGRRKFFLKDCVVGAFPLPERRLDMFRLGGHLPAAVPDGAGSVPLRQGCVLALIDLGAQGTNAAWRAGLVARDRGVPLHLLCVQSDARELDAVEARVQELARQVRQRLHIAAHATCVSGGLREQLAAHAGDAGLLVLPWRRGNPLVDALLGTLPERLSRALSTPMLVVRRPAFSSYRRVLVPVKLDADAVALVTAARAMSRDPRMRVFHVLDTTQEGSLRLADTSERVLRLQRQRRARTAYGVLNAAITRAGAHEHGAVALVSFGQVPLRVLEIERAGNAQLVVAGKERRSLISEALSAGVTRRLLREASADVLVLPVRAPDPGGGAALPPPDANPITQE